MIFLKKIKWLNDFCLSSHNPKRNYLVKFEHFSFDTRLLALWEDASQLRLHSELEQRDIIYTRFLSHASSVVRYELGVVIERVRSLALNFELWTLLGILKNNFSRISNNSEAFASELLENHEKCSFVTDDTSLGHEKITVWLLTQT